MARQKVLKGFLQRGGSERRGFTLPFRENKELKQFLHQDVQATFVLTEGVLTGLAGSVTRRVCRQTDRQTDEAE